ncbi:MAG: hypothetical protein PHU14_09785 [Methylovulum sp.]|nr:hypothetical protein [Methylovulum sp.]
MEITLAGFLKATYKKTKKPLAYILIVGLPLLKLSHWPYAPEVTLITLGLILLPAFFEIHDKIVEPVPLDVFENFQSASNAILHEIETICEKNNTIKIRYLGLAAYHWPHIEAVLTSLLRKSKSPKKLNLQLLMIDPKWSGVDDYNPNWKDIVFGTIGSMNNFKAVNSKSINDLEWSIEFRQYQFIPQLWGILLDDSVLFLSTSYWDSGRLRGGHNPIETIRSDGKFARIKIAEFNGWFDFFWEQNSTR